MKRNETWYHCILYHPEPYICFGIAAVDGKVTKAEKSMEWMIGKELKTLRGFFQSRKAQVTEVK